MRAIVFDTPGDESVLRVGDIPSPRLGRGEVRIAVAAAGVNRADLLQRRGMYPPPEGASQTLGLECAGTVSEVGEGVLGVSAGDRVMALLAGGGYAEEAVVDARCVMPTPAVLDDASAAGLPEVFLTAYLNLFEMGGLTAGSTALVHGGSGGVGTAAIQLARSVGARIFVTAGSDERCRRCRDLGADLAINHRTEDFVARCLAATGGHGVDVVLDCVGAPYLERHLRLLAPDGRLVVIGLMGGARSELDMVPLLRHRISIHGSTLRSRTPAAKGRIIAGFQERFGTLVESRALAPVIDRTLPLAEAGEAHRLLAAGAIFGKVVLRIG